jgi:hypothetical protein
VVLLATAASTATVGIAWLRVRDDPRTFVPPGSVPEMRLRRWLGQYWGTSREGALRAGDPAPDFDLPVLHTAERVRLSSWRGQRPVALVFGSYT